MGTMNVSLPDAMKEFVDEQVAARGYGTSSEYIRDLIRKEQDRERVRALLLDGLESGPAEAADAAFFQGLRERIAQYGKKPAASRGAGAKARTRSRK